MTYDLSIILVILWKKGKRGKEEGEGGFLCGPSSAVWVCSAKAIKGVDLLTGAILRVVYLVINSVTPVTVRTPTVSVYHTYHIRIHISVMASAVAL